MGCWTGRWRWTPRSTGHISTRRTRSGTQGDLPNYKNLGTEPPDHGIGRSRGGLSTKVHHLVDGAGRPLTILIGPGQAGDSPILPELLAGLRVPRTGPGRPRTRPDAVLGDKAYCARAHRLALARRGIKTVIPERDDQIRNRKNRGSKGGRPPTLDTEAYKGRNVVERSFNTVKQWRGLATRFDKHAINYHAAVVLSAVITWLKTLIGDTP